MGGVMSEENPNSGLIVALVLILAIVGGAVWWIASVTKISGKAEFHISFNEESQTPEQAAQIALEAFGMPGDIKISDKAPQHKPVRKK